MMTSPSGPCGRLDAEYRSTDTSCERVSSEGSGVHSSDSGTVVAVPSPLPGAVTSMTLSGGR